MPCSPFVHPQCRSSRLSHCCEGDGGVPILQVTEVWEGEPAGCSTSLLCLVGVCSSSAAFCVCSALWLSSAPCSNSSCSRTGIGANEEWQDRYEAERKNKNWGLVADGWGDVLLKEELGKVDFRSGFGDLRYRLEVTFCVGRVDGYCALSSCPWAIDEVQHSWCWISLGLFHCSIHNCDVVCSRLQTFECLRFTHSVGFFLQEEGLGQWFTKILFCMAQRFGDHLLSFGWLSREKTLEQISSFRLGLNICHWGNFRGLTSESL